MKARFSVPFALSLALSILPFVGACTEDKAASALFASSANAQPAIVATTTNPPAPAAEAGVAATDLEAATAAPEPAPATERKLPPAIRTNSPATDVIKLAQAGVDETVMLTFITNTASMFVLTPDEIIYLNDIGVPSTVVTAMMQRDQEIRQHWTNAGQLAQAPAVAATATVTDAQAAAPTYVDPPQPEPQPAPVEPTPPTVINDNYFNDTLSPYGTWVDIEGYGRCWQPTVVVVNRNWRPYSDGGRWVYSDAGWYWFSDYSWGATTFHYGRWFNHARWGWCWWPDTVWAPSWVSFRYSSDYCGWAPLPPHAYYRAGLGFSYYGRSVGFGFDFGLNSSCFTFVSWNRFCDSRPWHHRVHSHEANRIYNNTTIVNNYVTGDNNTVINRGIGRDRVRDLSRTEVKTVSLRDEGVAAPGRGGRRERLERDGRTLVVNRPLPAQRERPNMDGGKAGRSTLIAPVRSENTPVTAETRTPRPSQRERVETSRAGTSPIRLTPGTLPEPSPSQPVTIAPKAESRPTRERTLPDNRGLRPRTITPPLIVNGSQSDAQPTTPAPAPAEAPSSQKIESPTPVARPSRPPQGSLIVIGKPSGGAPAGNRISPINNSLQNPSRPVQSQVTPPTSVPRSQSPIENATPQPADSSALTRSRTMSPPTRTEIPQITRSSSSPSPARSQLPVYSSPTRSNPSAPNISRPAPNYSPRVANPAPSPSYSPPVISTPRPAPPVSAPSYSPPTAPSVSAPSFTPRPAPSTPPPSVIAPAASAPRSSPPESRPAPSSGSRPDSGRRQDR